MSQAFKLILFLFFTALNDEIRYSFLEEFNEESTSLSINSIT